MPKNAKNKGSEARGGIRRSLGLTVASIALMSVGFASLPDAASAQSYRFNTVSIEGNRRIEAGTILSYAGIARGETVSAGELNAAYQNILASGLFQSVNIEPRGNTLVIVVEEYPTINQISFEGNKRLKDEDLAQIINSRSRQVFSPSAAELDAQRLSEAYEQAGRVSATITPKVIRRSDNRVDLVFEVFEGKNTEVQRIGFVGNRAFSDNRLRRVLGTKQAGILHALVRSDTFIEDRIQFDRQMLNDFYQSRGYVDFRITGVNAEIARERDAYFVTFNLQEGQQFRFGEITTVSEYEGVDGEEYQEALKIKPGVVYSPSHVENSIARMERLAVANGLDFLRVEPRITRNDRDLTLDVEFVLTKGPRIFIERIDIEGNTTTLDRVVRRQFDAVEGDPFNPREIREAAERIRALGFFSDEASVNAREGSRPDQVVVDVDVEEQPTGSIGFGGTYSTDSGFGLNAQLTERNFLGRGQAVSFQIGTTDDNTAYGFSFTEPAFLGRDVSFNIGLNFSESTADGTTYDTSVASFNTGLGFRLGEKSRLNIGYIYSENEMKDYSGIYPTGIIANEVARGNLATSALTYRYTYDSRLSGLNPNAGVLVSFGQKFAGLGGDTEYVQTTFKAIAQTKVYHEEITLRATLEAGSIDFQNGSSRAIDRFSNSDIMRGFETTGIGPREGTEYLGGDKYLGLRFEAEFPLGLPEEYGLSGGVFYDIGSVWGIDQTNAVGAVTSSDFEDRHSVGVSLLWDSQFGPLRFNWSKPVKKVAGDIEQNFEMTISTQF